MCVAATDGKKLRKDTVYMTFISDSIKIRYAFNGAETSYHASTFQLMEQFILRMQRVRIKESQGQYTLVR
jgi:hypothetical protein